MRNSVTPRSPSPQPSPDGRGSKRGVTVSINLARIRSNAAAIAARTGVDVIAVVKADAYGLGAAGVAKALADIVTGFYAFDLAEAAAANLKRYGKPIIALLDESDDPAVYRDAGVRPVVWTAARAAALRSAGPVCSIDTGQQRFAAAAADVPAILAAGDIDEAMTHASTTSQAKLFANITNATNRSLRRHAAGSSLLDIPAARFDAVRPGLALYADAVRASARLIDARESRGPVGYTGFTPATGRHGVILAGYANGLRPGPCRINGEPRRIVEVGMQTAFVEIDDGDRVGDEVVLLGEGMTTTEIAASWRTSEQEVLVRLANLSHSITDG